LISFRYDKQLVYEYILVEIKQNTMRRKKEDNKAKIEFRNDSGNRVSNEKN